MPSAAVLIVGDEILEGHTQDTNSHYLAQRLAAKGIRLRRIVVCSDDVDDIAQQLARLTEDRFEFLFVCGGIGPTPDDRTYESVAIAASVPLVVTPQDEAWMRQRAQERTYAPELLQDDDAIEPLRRMVRRPEGSVRIDNPVGAALGSAVTIGATTVFVLPGVPRELRAMMEQVVEPRFLDAHRRSDAIAELEYVGAEARLYRIMREVEARAPNVRLGSYPQDQRGRVILRLQGPRGEVLAALVMLEKALPAAKRLRAP
jgi:molybdenum cofactor synthesis domain-containing protein